MDIHSINKRIAELCAKNDWSYYKLSKEAGFQQSTLKSITKEKNMPSLYTLSKICRAFGITISDFFNSELFVTANKQLNDDFINLWNELSLTDKEKVMIYMHGLLHKEIKKEDVKNDI